MLVRKKSDPSYLLGQFVAMFQLIEECTNKSEEAPVTEKNIHKLSENPASILPVFQKELFKLEKKARDLGKSVWVDEIDKIYDMIPIATLQDTPLNNDEYMKGYFQQLEGHRG